MFTHTVHMYTLSLCKRTTSHKTEDARGSCTEDYKKTSMSFLLHFFGGMTLGLNLNFLSKSAVSSLVFFFSGDRGNLFVLKKVSSDLTA